MRRLASGFGKSSHLYATWGVFADQSADLQVADDFLHSRIAPSKQLLRHVREEITSNPQFTLLDEQQVAYEVVLRAVEHAKRSDAKEAVVITGGPGTARA